MNLIKISKELEKACLWILVGPTASGKTSLAIEIAKRADCEIISADSLQIYREFNIGSAKPSKEQLKEVKHHLISSVSPLKVLNAYEYSQKARKAILDILSRGKQPLLVGGSGLYIKAVVDGLVKIEDHSETKREELYKELSAKGLPALYMDLTGVDPEAAAKIHFNDEFRIIRALELFRLTGKTRKESAKTAEPFKMGNFIFLGLNIEKQLLYKRINDRVDSMIKDGLLEEVKKITEKYGFGLHPLKALGYSQFVDYLKNIISFEAAVTSIKTDTRHYAKRQVTWFKKEPRIKWLEVTDDNELLLITAIKKFTEKKCQ